MNNFHTNILNIFVIFVIRKILGGEYYLKTYNSDKSIRPTSKSDNLKNIINSNINEKSFTKNSKDDFIENNQTEVQSVIQSDYLISQDALNDYIDIQEKTTTDNLDTDNIDIESDSKIENANYDDNPNENPNKTAKNKAKKQKISFKKIFLNSEFYTFFKVWLNLNRWGVFLYLIFAASTVVFFVYNVRKVNMLLAEIRQLNKAKIELQGKNKILEVKLVELQSPERINKIAIEQLGFIKATEAPFYIKRSN